MNILRSIAMSFSMFSRIPMPKVEWKKENMQYTLCALPLVGLAVGLLLWLWTKLALGLHFGNALFAAGITLLPIAVTGGIHLDGFADTVDALCSHAEPKRKREILKDPHSGAFAVIWVCAYLIAYLSLGMELQITSGIPALLLLIPVLSRVISASLSLVLPANGEEGLLKTFRTSADQRSALIILMAELAAALVLVFCISPGALIGMLIAMVGAVLTLHRLAGKEFQGMSGDLAGFAIVICELGMLFMVMLMQKARLL